jgi:predicted dehydrogenase
MPKPIRVGIVGASAEGGWAREGHVPAVEALDGLELVAVATTVREQRTHPHAPSASRPLTAKGWTWRRPLSTHYAVPSGPT